MGTGHWSWKPLWSSWTDKATVMRVLAAIFCLAIGASAQVGPSGIVNPDGTQVQFTAEQANNIASIGPSGIVTNDGRNLQLPAGKESFTAADIPTPIVSEPASLPQVKAGGVVGASGIVHEDGNTQFTREQAENIVVAGPSGVVTKDGRNIQFRTKRALVGPSGLILADGTPVQFRAEEMAVRSSLTDEQNLNAVVIGPSGIVNRDGKNTQLNALDAPTVLLDGPSGQVMTDGSLVQKVVKRSLIGPSGMFWHGMPVQFSHEEGRLRSGLTPEQYSNAVVVGPSGIVGLDGKNVQFDAPAAPTVLLDGPSGQVMSDGRLIQKRAKRSAGYVLPAGNIGHSGILRKDGSTDLFSHNFAHNIVLIGPSGIVTKDGSNVQLSDDLRRVKRSLIGPSGMFWNGMPVQFSHEEGRLRSDLTPEQYSNAVVVGPSGIVGLDGKNVQFDAPAAPTVLLDGPSGQVMSDGRLIQKSA